MSNSRPSRPTRALAEEDRPAEREPHARARAPSSSGEQHEQQRAPATIRSSAYLTRELPALRVERCARQRAAGRRGARPSAARSSARTGAARARRRRRAPRSGAIIAQQDLVRRRREGDDDVLDRRAASISRSRSQLAPSTGSRQPLGVVERLLVEEADRLRPSSGCSSRRFAVSAADAAGADDQGRPGELAAAAGARAAPSRGHAAGGEVDRAEGQQPQRLRREVVHVAGKEDPEAEDRHRRQRRRRQDAAQVVEHRHPQAPASTCRAGEAARARAPRRARARRARRGGCPASPRAELRRSARGDQQDARRAAARRVPRRASGHVRGPALGAGPARTARAPEAPRRSSTVASPSRGPVPVRPAT